MPIQENNRLKKKKISPILPPLSLPLPLSSQQISGKINFGGGGFYKPELREREESHRAWRDDREASSAVVNEGDAAKQGPLCGGALSYNAGALGGDTAAARPREGAVGGGFHLAAIV